MKLERFALKVAQLVQVVVALNLIIQLQTRCLAGKTLFVVGVRILENKLAFSDRVENHCMLSVFI